MPHALDTHIRTAHAVAGIRGSLLRAPDSPPLDLHGGPVAEVLQLPTPRPTRDGATRVGALAPVDSQGRASMRRVLTALGWPAGAPLRVTVAGASAVVRAGGVAAPDQTRVHADGQGRLCLPPAVTGALDLFPGDQVLAVALPARGELHLRAGADVLEEVTGPVEAAPGLEPAPAAAPPPRIRIRPRFTPDAH